MRNDFTYTTESNPHGIRSKAILKQYPEIRNLIKHYPLSALYTVLITILQVGVAYLVKDSSVWIMLLCAFLIGAIANHALFVMIHEACHNAIFKGNTANKIWGIISNLAQGFPSAIGFRTFHLFHHSNLNELAYDADLAFHFEAKLVRNIWWRKIIWYFLFMLIEAIRPMKLKNIRLFEPWVIINIVVVLLFDVMIYIFIGPMALYYILFSTFFSVGLHPVGARWIQEHYTYKEGQETYSYYGPLNKLSFNIGYHNEHHDFIKIPWIYLPKVREIAPEYYNTLFYHTSWTKVLLDFIFNKKIDLYMRIVRKKSKLK